MLLERNFNTLLMQKPLREKKNCDFEGLQLAIYILWLEWMSFNEHNASDSLKRVKITLKNCEKSLMLKLLRIAQF